MLFQPGERGLHLNPRQEHPSRAQLSAFLAGKLDEGDQEAVTQHIAGCDACCQILRDIPEDALVVRLRDTSTPVEVVESDLPASDRLVPPELADHPRYKIGKFL